MRSLFSDLKLILLSAWDFLHPSFGVATAISDRFEVAISDLTCETGLRCAAAAKKERCNSEFPLEAALLELVGSFACPEEDNEALFYDRHAHRVRQDCDLGSFPK